MFCIVTFCPSPLSLSISLQEQSLQAGIGVLYLLSDDFMKVVRLGRDISPYFVGFHQRASAYLCGPKESLLWRKHQGPPLQGESSVDFAFNLHLLYQRIITEQLAINYLVHLVPSKLVSKDLSAETWLKDDASIPQTSFCRRIQLSTT